MLGYIKTLSAVGEIALWSPGGSEKSRADSSAVDKCRDLPIVSSFRHCGEGLLRAAPYNK